MLKKFLCIYVIATCSFFSLSAEDNQTSNTVKPASGAIILQDQQVEVEAINAETNSFLVVTEEKRIAPGILACDCAEENCTKDKKLVEETTIELKDPATLKTNLAGCKACKKKKPKEATIRTTSSMLACKDCK